MLPFALISRVSWHLNFNCCSAPQIMPMEQVAFRPGVFSQTPCWYLRLKSSVLSNSGCDSVWINGMMCCRCASVLEMVFQMDRVSYWYSEMVNRDISWIPCGSTPISWSIMIFGCFENNRVAVVVGHNSRAVSLSFVNLSVRGQVLCACACAVRIVVGDLGRHPGHGAWDWHFAVGNPCQACYAKAELRGGRQKMHLMLLATSAGRCQLGLHRWSQDKKYDLYHAVLFLTYHTYTIPVISSRFIPRNQSKF
jgi:hypothetical protein